MRKPSKKSALLLIILAAALQGAISGYVLTLFPLMMETGELPAKIIGLANSAEMGAIIAVTLTLRFFLHRISLPQLHVSACMAGVIVMVMLSVGLGNIPLHVFLRFILGCCLSIIYIVFEYWLNSTLEDRYRGKVLACYGIAVAAGIGSGPLLIPMLGLTGFLVYFPPILFFASSAIITFFSRSHAPSVYETNSISGFKTIFTTSSALMLTGLCYGMTESSIFAFLSIYGLRQGLTQAEAVSLISCVFWGGMMMQLALGSLADRFKPATILMAATATVAIGAVLLPQLISTESKLFWIYMLVWGGTIPAIYTLAATCIGHAYKGISLANATLAFILMYGAGSMLGPNIAGAVTDYISIDGLPWVIGFACGVPCLFIGWQNLRKGNI